MPREFTGVDIGARSVKALQGYAKGNTFVATGFSYAERARGTDGWAAGWEALDPDFKLARVRIGLSGRDVNVRYVRVPRVPDWQLKKLMRFEVEEVGGQSGAEVASDFNVLPELPELDGEDVVLLAMARESLLEEHLEGLAQIGAKLDSFTPNAIALYNAWLRYGVLEDDTVLVANLGHENLDVVIARGADLLFARNLSGGAKLFDEAIAQRLAVAPERASALKHEAVDLDPAARFANADAEKASRACLAPAGQVLSLLQSAVLFCKSQVKVGSLKLDRVVLCGGGARTKGLQKYLANALGTKVELFDPFRVVDTSQLAPEQLRELEGHTADAVVALGLATMASSASAYRIEIVPASVHKRRAFALGTSWLIAAGVLALGFLAAYGLQAWQQLGLIKRDVAALEAKSKSAKATDARTRALIAESTELEDYASELAVLAGSGAQLGHALDALATGMPPDFWITKLSSSWRFDPELGIPKGEPRPVLHVEGAAREGTNAANVLFQELLAKLAKELPGAAFKPALSPTGQSFTIDLCEFAPAGAAATAAPLIGAKNEPAGHALAKPGGALGGPSSGKAR